MVRGFLAGIIWGVIVSGVVAGVASMIAPMPDAPAAPLMPDVEASLIDDAVPADPAQPPGATEGATGGATTPPAPDDLQSMEGADTAPAPQPEAGAADTALATPVADGDAPVLSTETPVEAAPSGAPEAPAAPAVDTGLSISAGPVQPPAPALPQVDGAFEPQPAPVETPATDAGDVSPGAEAGEPVPAEEDMIELPIVEDDAPETDLAGLAPQVGEPATALEQAFEQHDSGRLPTVGDEAEAPAADDDRPVVRYAADFADTGDKPLMAIVLIDDGASGIGAEALADFPYPISFAVNALMPDATEVMASYRRQGFEVLAMVDIPETATATDVEQAIPASLRAVPEAIGLLEGTGAGLQGNRALSDQVTAVLKDTGHGLILQANGLNTAQKLAAREGVPSAHVFRDFDSKGQKPRDIRRFLDQAAFKAEQEGGVVMLGRLRPDTVSALLLWGLADRASTVTLAPASALLKTQN